MIDPSQDAFGTALLDYLDGNDVAPLALQVQGGETGPAMHPEWFFRDYEQWDHLDQKILAQVEHGPVLDLGAGAGRAALYLQERGLSVTAIDASPGAVEVCRRRGIADVRLGDLRLRYRDLVTPWWPQYNIPSSQLAALVKDTGWAARCRWPTMGAALRFIVMTVAA